MGPDEPFQKYFCFSWALLVESFLCSVAFEIESSWQGSTVPETTCSGSPEHSELSTFC